MMQRDDSRTDLGLIRIHKNAITQAASLAALEVDGVKRIGKCFKSNILELIGKPSLPAIKIEINKADEVNIEIPLFIKYGFNIPEAASKVQESVRQALEKMTDLCVKDIDINVQGIERGNL